LKKLYPLTQLVSIIQKEKGLGKRIVLANGCFDLIHIGHIRYLKESKKEGDVLILALNSDTSIQKLKGKGRPVLNEKARIDILSSFSYVDYITTFNENDVSHILLSLKPHVHAKGSDYTEETVPERDIVRSYGGETAITGGVKIRSTTKLIEEIRKKI